MAGRRRHTERHGAASAIDRLLFGTELARGERVQLEEGGAAASEAGFYVVARIYGATAAATAPTSASPTTCGSARFGNLVVEPLD